MRNELFLDVRLRDAGFSNLKTNKYKLHFHETGSGIKFILNTDLEEGNCTEYLKQLHHNVSVFLFLGRPAASGVAFVSHRLCCGDLAEP